MWGENTPETCSGRMNAYVQSVVLDLIVKMDIDVFQFLIKTPHSKNTYSISLCVSVIREEGAKI